MFFYVQNSNIIRVDDVKVLIKHTGNTKCKSLVLSFSTLRDWSKSIGGVGRSREGVGHEVLSLV